MAFRQLGNEFCPDVLSSNRNMFWRLSNSIGAGCEVSPSGITTGMVFQAPAQFQKGQTLFSCWHYSTFSIPLSWLASLAFFSAIAFLLRLPDFLLFFRSQMPSRISFSAVPSSIFIVLPSTDTRPSDSVLLRTRMPSSIGLPLESNSLATIITPLASRFREPV